jgi:hypothetical protein
MEFNESKMLQEQFMKMCATGKLFRSKVTGSQLWETYMRGFGEDPIFRDPESSVHNCNQCKHFFHRYGNIVAIAEDLSIMTMFDAPVTDEYKESFRLMSEQLKNSEIEDVFVETFDYLNNAVYARVKKDDELFALNLDHTVKRYTKEEAEKFGVVKPNETRTFNHFCVRVPNIFISKTLESVDYLQAKYREDKNIFMRGLEEIPAETLKLVIDLIGQGSLLDGDTHKFKVVQFLAFAEQYANIPEEKRDNWCWVNSYKLNIARFKNELIGKLCIELAEGKELNKACQDWNIRVDPKNYMKATAPITQQMIDNAKAFIAEAGYEESFVRRCATIEDIKVSDILHVNTGDGKIKPVSILDGIKPTSTRHKRSEFKNVEVVPIEKFMKDILPECTSVEVFLQYSQKNNFVTLTTPVNKNSLPIFKWKNNFGWTYNGNLAGKSEIKEAVKAAGGFVDAFFRFSIMWNEDGRSIVDLDAHAVEPNGTHIYFGSYNISRNSNNKTSFGGCLDIDMIDPLNVGVENIFWTEPSKLRDGAYRFYIHNFDSRHNSGAKAEIAFGEDVYTYLVDHEIMGNVDIATVHIKNGHIDHIEQSKYLVDCNETSTEIYGLETNKFHKVNLVCLSPNHWDGSVGNKHYFFMLEGAKAPESIRGFHNEFLIPELLEHRKVMEVLGNTMKVESTDNQLSGLGFNSTVRDEVILRLQGSHKRVIKVQF